MSPNQLDMNSNFNFLIGANGKISKNFLSRNISDFKSAITFIRQLPYGRNKDKRDLTTLFNDGFGTCSTKHAVLKELAVENSFSQIKLMLALFKMNKYNTPAISKILLKENLEYIPEAHNYLKIENSIVDCTFPNSFRLNFINDLITETEIESNQIGDYKVSFHKQYLKTWLLQKSSLTISLQNLWIIREKCIAALCI